MKRTDIIGVMNDLVETANDGVHGFRTCAAHVSADELKQLLEQHARAWEGNISRLTELIFEYGGTPVAHGTAIGAVHRGWLRLKEALSSVDDDALLAECERGEEQALARYRRAFKHAELPDAIRELIAQQGDAIEGRRSELGRHRAHLHSTA
jgi:uncharacterized protein (TIGR02284 family)